MSGSHDDASQAVIAGVSRVVKPDEEPPTVEQLRDWILDLGYYGSPIVNRVADAMPGYVLMIHPKDRSLFYRDLIGNAVNDGKSANYTIGELHRVWQDSDADTANDPHPLRPLLEAWHSRPQPVQAETRKDKGIWPKVEAIPPDAGRRQGMVFAGDHAGIEANGQLKLVPDVEPTKAPLLDLVDCAGLPVMAQGRGAPLALRFAIMSLLAVRMDDRGRDRTVQVPITVRDLIQGLYPNGWQRGRDWPKVRAVLESMHGYVYPLPDGAWRPWAVPWVPYAPALDDVLTVNVNLIRQIKAGPEIDLHTLGQLGISDGPRFRAYLAAPAIAWVDGVTRVPVAKERGQWRYARDLNKYPVITRDDRRRLAYGPHDLKNRTRTDIDRPWEQIPGMRLVDRCARDRKRGIEGWRIVPEAVANDDPTTYLTGENDLPNRGE